MPLNVKNDQAHSLAKELAELTGQFIVPMTRSWAAMKRGCPPDGRRRIGDRCDPRPGTRRFSNFGDCFAYALSRTTGEPLLFKGDAFAQTDVVPVTRP